MGTLQDILSVDLSNACRFPPQPRQVPRSRDTLQLQPTRQRNKDRTCPHRTGPESCRWSKGFFGVPTGNQLSAVYRGPHGRESAEAECLQLAACKAIAFCLDARNGWVLLDSMDTDTRGG